MKTLIATLRRAVTRARLAIAASDLAWMEARAPRCLREQRAHVRALAEQLDALDALLGVFGGELPGALGDAEAFGADRQARRIHHHEHGFQPAAEFADQVAGGAAVHVGDQGGEHLAAVAGDLAAGEVGGLDGGGAFVDRGDAGVAHVLGDAGFFDEAHAAENLDRQRGEFHRAFGAPALEHRGQQFDAAVGGVAGGVVVRLVGHIL